jgi:hypothetical protein
MPQTRRWIGLGLLALLLCGGCMPGMTYRIPMPSSLTFGTIKADEATLASDQPRAIKPTIGPRTATDTSSDVAMATR